MSKIAESIVTNLKSPDIVGLVEIQDNDGENKGAATGSAANQTLDNLVAAIKTAGGPEYKWINIDPEENKDGGAPGGNIRVAYIYNPARVTFDTYGNADYKTLPSVNTDGTLNANPVRIGYGNSAFDSSRKSLVAQFKFNGEAVTVIANHLNSKGGDSSMWGAVQPVQLGSVTQRKEMTKTINAFAQSLVSKNQKVVLLGDFNEFYFEDAMKEFKAPLTNLLETLPLNQRFTYVFNGNAQTLDHILVSTGLANGEVDIVNMNSPFGKDQISDHDPRVSRFHLPVKK